MEKPTNKPESRVWNVKSNKVEVLIPTKQYSNIKFEVWYHDEAELDKEITRLWRKYYNFFEAIDLHDKLNKNKLNYEAETEIQAESELDN